MSKASERDWVAWVALRAVRGVGNVVGRRLIELFGGPREVFDEGSQRLECAGVRRRLAREVGRFDDWAGVDDQLRRLEQVGGRLVTWQDADYPSLLRHIYDPPLVLYVRGDLDQIADSRPPTVAVVGSRRPSDYGRRMARSLAADLGSAGMIVVSGLARGIDAEAHRACLRSGSKTIAVLGCGVDVAYPGEHHHLMMQIARQGAVISELPMGTQPDAENFPGRNRIVSGISVGTVVIEAAERSGSLITAHYAAEQGRDVFAVPGPVGKLSRGPHRLLRDGAILAENANDVLRELAPERGVAKVDPRAGLTATEAAVLACVGDGATPVDEIVEACGLATSRALEILLALELRGLVRPRAGKCYALEEAARSKDKSE